MNDISDFIDPTVHASQDKPRELPKEPVVVPSDYVVGIPPWAFLYGVAKGWWE